MATSYQRMVPGGPLVNETRTAQQMIPGGPLIAEKVAAAPPPPPAIDQTSTWLVIARRHKAR